MRKRGQFYLIAAVVIIIAIVGILTLQNYAKKEGGDTRIYDLGEELEGETGYVYDYGVYNNADTQSLIENWSDTYYEYGEEGESWIFVYGDEENLTALKFSKENSGDIGIVTGGRKIELETISKIKEKGKIKDIEEGEVELEFRNFSYPFELKEGENFFFVISSEKYATTSKNEE
jgi:hypothetical protein